MTSDSPSALPVEIEIEEDAPGRVRYRLPKRDLGRARRVAWLVVCVGLALADWMLERPVLQVGANWPQGGGVVGLLLWLAIAFFLVGLPVRFALLLLFGHCEIELGDGQLAAIERAGLLRRSKKWPLPRLKRLQVVGLLAPENSVTTLRQAAEALVAEHQAGRPRRGPRVPDREDPLATEEPPAKKNLLANANALTGVLDDGKRFLLVAGYPRDWLTRLADDLSARCATTSDRAGELQVEAAAPVLGLPSIVAEAKQDLQTFAEPDVFDQPPGSDVQVEWFPDGITLRVPPRGIRKGSAGLFQFGILWCVGIAGFTLLFAAAGIVQGAGVSGFLSLLAVMSIFWLAGAGLLLGAWNMGKREAVVAVVAEKVMVMQTGLRRATRREWPRSEVKTVRVGPSGTEINDVPVPELQIQGATKKLFGMLAGRDPRELTWMATLLRQALKNSDPMNPPTAALETPADEDRPSDAENQLPATQPDKKLDYGGMTINERLQVAGLSDLFGAAVGRRDRSAMRDLLLRVQLPEAGANAWIDTVLADPKQYGY